MARADREWRAKRATRGRSRARDERRSVSGGSRSETRELERANRLGRCEADCGRTTTTRAFVRAGRSSSPVRAERSSSPMRAGRSSSPVRAGRSSSRANDIQRERSSNRLSVNGRIPARVLPWSSLGQTDHSAPRKAGQRQCEAFFPPDRIRRTPNDLEGL